jgi:putative nucleotide binding protein
MKDEYLIVLDFLARGGVGEPTAQGIGEKYFNLLEVTLKQKVDFFERVYIGSGPRDKVGRIVRRLNYDQLTTLAKENLEKVLPQLIEKNEERFVKFFNLSGPITPKLHSLELLPGIGKKHLWQIVEERKNKPFQKLSEINERIKLLPDVKKMIAKRIIEELQGKDEYRLFVGNPQF